MNAVVILLVGLAILVVAYITYGKWLAKQWGIDPSRPTPAHEMEDGRTTYLRKRQFFSAITSSIAGAGPINGPIQAAVFGWVPVLLWVLVGGIFSSALSTTSARCSLPSVIKDSPSVK